MGGDPLGELAAMMERTRRLLERTETDMDRVDEAVRSVTVVGSNRDGSVKVKVNHHGGLEDLKLTDAAMRMTPDQLRAEILRGVGEATRHVADRVGRAAESVYGKGDGMAAWLRDGYAENLRSTPVDRPGDGR